VCRYNSSASELDQGILKNNKKTKAPYGAFSCALFLLVIKLRRALWGGVIQMSF
jgi:hypothetical protein